MARCFTIKERNEDNAIAFDEEMTMLAPHHRSIIDLTEGLSHILKDLIKGSKKKELEGRRSKKAKILPIRSSE